MAALYFDARIDAEKLQQDIANINKQLGRITQSVKKEGDEIDGLTKRMGASLAGAFSIFAAGSFVKDIARVRGEFQQLEVAFETMLGNKDAADKLMAQVVQFAAKTPFELQDVASGAKQLLAYGTAAEDIIPTLKALGDVSAGLSVPIERLILNYGQVRTQLKLTGRELRDFQVAGVPIVAELAKQVGVSEQKIQEMVTAGEIGFDKVEKAFASMTSEGGRFNDLMDKQALTITGLASNFADAWDRMLNSIGQQNEGIIANVIKGATEVVDNYEEVIKVLGVLIATYGTYKAAVIATGVATRLTASYGVFDIATKKLQTAATLKAAAAQTALNVAASVNPYIAIATAVAGLIALLVTYGKETKKAEEYVNDLNEAVSKLGEQTNVDNLIKKYDELKDKANKTEAEQSELNSTIQELAKLFPETITGINNYGNAIDITREKLVALNEEQRKYLEQEARSTLEESQKKRNELLERQAKIQKEIETKTSDASLSGWKMVGTKLDNDQIKQKIKDYNDLTKEISELGVAIFNSQELLTKGSGQDIEKFKTQYRELFSAVSGIAEEELKNRQAKLTQLIFAGNANPEIISALKNQIDVINAELGLDTVEVQVAKAKADITAAEARIKVLQSSKSRTKESQIDEQNAIIKSSQELLAKYGIETGKAAAKTLEEQKKAKEEQLQADQYYADAKLSLERSLQASIIATQKEGAERQRKEADLQFQLDIDRINAEKDNYLQARNAVAGIKKGDAGYDESLSPEEFEKYDNLEIAAAIVKNQKIAEIERQSAERIKAINSEVTDAYLSDTDREIKAINEKYDALIKRAKEAGKDIEEEANKARGVETQSAIIRGKMQILSFEEEIEMQRAEISTQGFNREFEIEKKKLEIVKKFAKLKIDELKKSGTIESKQDIERLNLLIDASNEGLKELNKKSIQESVTKSAELVSQFKELVDVIGGADSKLSKFLGSLSDTAGTFAKIASGDYGAIFGYIKNLYTNAMDTSKINADLSKPWEEFEKWIAASNRELQRYIDLRDDAIGEDRYSNTDNVIQETIDKVKEAEAAMAKLQLSMTFEAKGWWNASDDTERMAKEWGESLGGTIEEVSYKAFNALGYEWGKGVYSFDLDQLFVSGSGEFTIEKINKLIDEGKITDKKVIESVEYYEGLLESLKQAEEQKQELLTATMSEDIANSIIDGFANGYSAAADFADDFEKLMKDAILNAVKIQTLEEPLKQWYSTFSDYSESDGYLTATEIEELQRKYDEIIAGGLRKFSDLQELSGLDFTQIEAEKDKQQGLTGAIKGITEETAGLIAGQFSAMRETGQKQYMTGLEQLDGINKSVGHLAEIAVNTRHNSRLVGIEEGISAMNKTLNERL